MTQIACDYVAVYPFRLRGGVPRYLMLQRAPTAYLPGIWQCVTGAIEPGETAVQAALRELREETGLAPTALWSAGIVGAFYDVKRDSVQLSPNFAACVPDQPIRLSGEHCDHRWVDLETAIHLALWQCQKDAYRWIHEHVATTGEVHPYYCIELPQ